MSSTIGIDELRDILVACAGGGDDALRGDILDMPFEDLGYDSLVLIEAAATLKRQYGVHIPDEQLVEALTPAELLVLINKLVGTDV